MASGCIRAEEWHAGAIVAIVPGGDGGDAHGDGEVAPGEGVRWTPPLRKRTGEEKDRWRNRCSIQYGTGGHGCASRRYGQARTAPVSCGHEFFGRQFARGMILCALKCAHTGGVSTVSLDTTRRNADLHGCVPSSPLGHISLRRRVSTFLLRGNFYRQVDRESCNSASLSSAAAITPASIEASRSSIW